MFNNSELRMLWSHFSLYSTFSFLQYIGFANVTETIDIIKTVKDLHCV